MVAKVGARTPREREQAGDSLNASPTRVGVPVRPSLRTGDLAFDVHKEKRRTVSEAPPTRRAGPDHGPRPGGPDRPTRGTQDGSSRSPPTS